jgi:hypothetical protein
VCALPHVCAGAGDDGALDALGPVQFHPGIAVFGKAQAEADILEADRRAAPVGDATASGVERGLVHAQRLGQLVHLALGGERPLRPAKAAERAAGHVVGRHGVAVHMGVGNLVGAGHHQIGVAQHLGAGIGVGPAVEDEFGLDSRQLAVLCRPPLGCHPRLVALVVADDTLLA